MNLLRLSLITFCLALTSGGIVPSVHAEEGKAIEVKAALVDGKKVWLPTEIKVKQGTTVKLHLLNQVPDPKNTVHGFFAEEFKIKELVDSKKPEGVMVEFKAEKKGAFPFSCHLHPAHVGGKIIVE